MRIAGPLVYVVTGATDGIGRLTAQKLGSDGHTVVVHGRSRAKVDEVCREVDAAGGSGAGVVADLSRLDDVRALGKEIKERFPVIDGLLNNAGTFAGDYSGERKVTADGNEYSLAVNVLAPFLLTALLLDNVRAAPAARLLVTHRSMPLVEVPLKDVLCRWDARRGVETADDVVILMPRVTCRDLKADVWRAVRVARWPPR